MSLNEARKIQNLKSKKEVVKQAIEQFIKYRRQRGILALEGTIDFDPSFDYKAYRKARVI